VEDWELGGIARADNSSLALDQAFDLSTDVGVDIATDGRGLSAFVHTLEAAILCVR